MKKYFLTGLAILLPLVITIAVLLFLINFLTKPFIDTVSSILNRFHILNEGFLFLSSKQLIEYGSKLLILFILFFVTVALGAFARWFMLNALLRFSDFVLSRIPFINTVYKTTQDIIKTLFSTDKKSFKKVVMVPFPREGLYILGLIAREAPPACSPPGQEPLISVFVPTTPNPTTGFLLMLKASDLIEVDLKPEEAIKYIVSCGVIVPGEKQNS